MHLIKSSELTEAVNQIDELTNDLIDKIWAGNIDDEVENLLKAGYIC